MRTIINVNCWRMASLREIHFILLAKLSDTMDTAGYV